MSRTSKLVPRRRRRVCDPRPHVPFSSEVIDIEDLTGSSNVVAHARAVHDFASAEVTEVRERLLVWYDATRRELPWRQSVRARARDVAPIHKLPLVSPSIRTLRGCPRLCASRRG